MNRAKLKNPPRSDDSYINISLKHVLGVQILNNQLLHIHMHGEIFWLILPL